MGDLLKLVPSAPVGEGFFIEPDRILDAAKGKLKEVYILGIDRDGEIYFAGTHGTSGRIALLLDRIKHFLITGEFK